MTETLNLTPFSSHEALGLVNPLTSDERFTHLLVLHGPSRVKAHCPLALFWLNQFLASTGEASRASGLAFFFIRGMQKVFRA